ncbi:MAG TPA: TonB-dependent receptor [Bryobacteraceae bacterium]|nr:TonB-dependent receptor [Bryobacteraceae bacterium]
MRSLLRSAVFFLFALSIFPQSDRGTITGTVSDPAGAVVASVPVEARSTTTGLVYAAATSGTGNYTISQLPVGAYDITVTAPGFKKAVRPGIEVSAFATYRVDFKLEVGAVTESVTITEATPLLKTESGELSHSITTESLANLPMLAPGAAGAGVRNPLASLTLLPGAQFANESILRINGMPSSSQSIRIEGQDATNGFFRQQNAVNQTGVDAIQEVAIQTSNFAAEFGQAGGGYINYTMRSGTNQYHGSAFDYLVNEALNAGTPFTDAGLTNSLKAGQHVRNSQRRNDFGGTFGGPIRIPKLYNGQDKTFFFFSIEAYIQKLTTTNGLNTVPTSDYQNGNFSAALNPALTIGGAVQSDRGTTLFGNQIFDPKTQTVVNGLVVRSPYVGNTIPKTDFDPVSVKVQALLPQPNAPGLVNNYRVPAYTNFQHTQVPTLKLDHNLSSSIKIAVFYSANHEYSPGSNGFTQGFTAATPNESLSQTTRVNYDQTVTPTVLLHFGAGLLHTRIDTVGASYNQSDLFGTNVFDIATQFPNITPGNDFSKGGSNIAMGNSSFALWQKDIKPTFNSSLTWVKGNHTFKFGGEAIFEGLPGAISWRSKGIFGFGAAETANPYTTGLTFQNGATGFAYASFLLGGYNNLQVQPLAVQRMGNHSFGLYAQDNWKVGRKLTIDYGIRYDFATLLAEQYGRMHSAAPNTPNPLIGGRNGTVAYGANTELNSNYPYAIGPRFGVAYKLSERTVLRGGAGVSYGTSPNNAFLTYSVPEFYSFNDQPIAGIAAGSLRDGNPFAPGNKFGNAPIRFPATSPPFPFQNAPGIFQPNSPFIAIDRHAGRLPRILQWSIGFQQELMKGLVVDASYVGNRGVWWTAPLLSTYAYNALTPASIQAAGLNPNSASDLALLTQPIASPDGTPNAAIAARFPNLRIVKTPNGIPTVPSVYPGFPATQALNQALRPWPQWNGIPPFLGPPLGDTWYDSLQVKVTRRLWHGLDAQYAFTWQKELILGTSNDTSYVVSAFPGINDVFNYAQNKQINPFSRPLVSVLALTYVTPRLPGDGTTRKALSWLTRDWTLGAVLRYQSGQLMPVALSNNNFLNQMARGASNNPALWGGGATMQNRVASEPLFLQDPNCHCFDPTKTLVLNPKAWSDVGPGQFGATAPWLDEYRWQRQPQESFNFGRIFAIAREGKVNLAVRVELQNVFNRVFYSLPANGGSGFFAARTGVNPTAPVLYNNAFANGQLGALSSGFGFVNTVNGIGTQPRSGQIVARFSF